jgi:hypothetical protein
MMSPRTDRVLRFTAAGGWLIAASACSEPPTATHRPMRPSPSLSEAGSQVEGATFVPNAVKYANRGSQPTIGRGGSATASVLALLSRDGSARITVVAGEWGGWTRGRQVRDEPYGDARLTKLQIKSFDPAGSLQFTRNLESVDAETTTVVAAGLLRGGRLQVQANVTGADFARTGVVTVDAPVRLRPDLAVVALRQPPRAVLNTAVPIVAVVRELNGEVGAWADCALLVDGVEADRAYGIWVDAGGSVTCAFTHMFRELRDTRLEVRVERVAPGDYDEANNAASSIMPVIRVPSAFHFDAVFEDRTFSSINEYQSRWHRMDGVEGSEYATTDTANGRVQQSHLYAVMPRAVTFPVRELFARQYTRDEVAHAALFQQLPADWTADDGFTRTSCVSRGYDQTSTGRWWLYVCTYQESGPQSTGFGWTSVSYDRYAGDVTYASRGHTHFWNRDLGFDDAYSWNFDSHDVTGRFVSYGLEYGFFIRLVDGTRVFTANPFVGLLPFEQIEHMPRTCWTYEDVWVVAETCSRRDLVSSGVQGWVSGEPSP